MASWTSSTGATVYAWLAAPLGAASQAWTVAQVLEVLDAIGF